MGRVLYWIAVLPLFLAVIVFAVSNHETVQLSLWPLLAQTVPFPVYGIALVALFVGFVLGGIVSWFQNGGTRHRVRELQRQSEAEQRELASLRERLSRVQAVEREATIPPSPLASAAPPIAAPTTAPVTAEPSPLPPPASPPMSPVPSPVSPPLSPPVSPAPGAAPAVPADETRPAAAPAER